MIQAIERGEEVEMLLDVTMTVIRLPGHQLLLHSPIPFDRALAQEISCLGDVAGLIAPNLNHYLFVPEWANHFRSANVYHTPPAGGTSLAEKFKEFVDPKRLIDLGSMKEGFEDVEYRLLEGAPLNFNETVFFHRPSETLITSDAFYGGYKPEDPHLSWFCRMWFKLMKGSWKNNELPVYRASQVKEGGDIEAVHNSIKSMTQDWPFSQIICAHGTNPYTTNPKDSFRMPWLAFK
eukprot:gb/GECG01003231.1/.p1 GENE.gb/GECG01003231.1/~~gb/GECG01003231.1/.p1  ORF type:complete len:235 (+),score=24.41 gb/GECG01003231.1/:1-705(+)